MTTDPDVSTRVLGIVDRVLDRWEEGAIADACRIAVDSDPGPRVAAVRAQKRVWRDEIITALAGEPQP